MAIAFRSIANKAYASTTNSTVTAPAGIANGDILLLYGFSFGAAPVTMTPPAGFATVSLVGGTNPQAVTDASVNDGTSYLWWKRAASEAGNYTITHAAASTLGVCMAISGAIASGEPTDVARSNGASNPSAPDDSTVAAITTTVADTLLCWFGHDWGDTANNLTPPSGMTERLDVTLAYVATQAVAAIGSTGARSMVNNSADIGTSPWAAFLIALKPEPPLVGVPIWLVTA